MRRGVRLGVDVGTVRIGVASCDPGGLIATPVETVRRGKGDLRRLRDLVHEYEAIEIVLGLPRSLDGKEHAAAAHARAFGADLARYVAPCPVRLVDERLSTTVAARGMRASGVSARAGRPAVDQAAAMVILQDALDAERATGGPPGEVLTVSDE
ncbi:Holliday junction resolvase RuvX [Jiangella sp. DSM 45060]|uniref:Holliday junction resolvase RuvX n=1 Tax=Jiangella sp. DSM 45060 TaxID=1798224 RepID=UPI00087C507E|nr:Holliday junction resolvase RuvX [Jiangella sp. DSM 45060]SDT03535.1 putative holliday junction resolvase [Jiangella sp. DSM 45060]